MQWQATRRACFGAADRERFFDRIPILKLQTESFGDAKSRATQERNQVLESANVISPGPIYLITTFKENLNFSRGINMNRPSAGGFPVNTRCGDLGSWIKGGQKDRQSTRRLPLARSLKGTSRRRCNPPTD
jgi:hypothetical protein